MQEDEIDTQILGNVKQNPGAPILKIIEPLLTQRSETVLRSRVRQLHLRGKIRFERTKHSLNCFLVGDDADGST
jgi:hypothetical protein